MLGKYRNRQSADRWTIKAWRLVDARIRLRAVDSSWCDLFTSFHVCPTSQIADSNSKTCPSNSWKKMVEFDKNWFRDEKNWGVQKVHYINRPVHRTPTVFFFLQFALLTAFAWKTLSARSPLWIHVNPFVTASSWYGPLVVDPGNCFANSQSSS